IALALGAAGADVAVNFRSGPGAAAEGGRAIVAGGGRAMAFQADGADEGEGTAMVGRIREAVGGGDVGVNNGGLQVDAPFAEMTLAQWNKVIAVNLTGQFLCAREAVREFHRRGRRPDVSRALGKIICISSVHEVIPWAGHVNYAASKGGVMLMMKSIAQEVAPL